MKHVPVNRIIQALYLLLAGILYTPLCHYLDCNDTLQYLILARHYASGDLMHAINSYWGPLLSWLLVPFTAIGLEGFFALKMIELAIGFAVLTLTCLLIDRRNPSPATALFFKLAAIPLIASFALLNGTPDLLALCWMLSLLSLLSEPEKYFSSMRNALICGLLGVMLYFTKTAGFFFFLILFSVLHFCFFLFRKETNRIRIARFFISGTAVFLLGSSLWMLMLSESSGKLSFSSSGRYNFGIIGPAVNPEVYGELNHPFYMGKLYEPANPVALNAWENPAAAPVPSWSPFHSKPELMHYFRVIWKNIRSIQSYNFGADPGTILILGWITLLLFRWKQALDFFSQNLIHLLFPVLLSTIYILVLVNHRYVWLNDLVILILAADLALRLAGIKKLIAFAFAAAFLLLVSYQSWTDIKPCLNDGTANWKAGKAFATLEPGPGRVASLSSDLQYSYDYSSLVCYLSGKKYLGIQTTTNKGQADPSAIFEKFNVKYIFAWGKYPNPDSLMPGRTRLLISYPEARLNIYTFQ
jgi:hypothetical protein